MQICSALQCISIINISNTVSNPHRIASPVSNFWSLRISVGIWIGCWNLLSIIWHEVVYCILTVMPLCLGQGQNRFHSGGHATETVESLLSPNKNFSLKWFPTSIECFCLTWNLLETSSHLEKAENLITRNWLAILHPPLLWIQKGTGWKLNISEPVSRWKDNFNESFIV